MSEESKSPEFLLDENGFIKGVKPEDLKSWLNAIRDTRKERDTYRQEVEDLCSFLIFMTGIVNTGSGGFEVGPILKVLTNKTKRAQMQEAAQKIAPILDKYKKP